MTRRRVSNPLALAILGCLTERPMHPYEISTTLRERGKEGSIKLNYGSLYAVVEALQKHHLIEAQETTREGRRPERTVYAITPAGVEEFEDWLAELLSTPVKEYLAFEAGLSLAAGAPAGRGRPAARPPRGAAAHRNPGDGGDARRGPRGQAARSVPHREPLPAGDAHGRTRLREPSSWPTSAPERWAVRRSGVGSTDWSAMA